MFLGATIIAGIIFFVLNLFSTLWLDPGEVTLLGAVLEAAIKTAVFGTLFHYIHNWIAKLFRWYRIDDPEARHMFDRNPALDQIREEG